MRIVRYGRYMLLCGEKGKKSFLLYRLYRLLVVVLLCLTKELELGLVWTVVTYLERTGEVSVWKCNAFAICKVKLIIQLIIPLLSFLLTQKCKHSHLSSSNPITPRFLKHGSPTHQIRLADISYLLILLKSSAPTPLSVFSFPALSFSRSFLNASGSSS